MVDNNMILAGAIPACILALVMDFIGGKIEQGVTPPGIKKADGTIKIPKRKKFKFSKMQKIIAASLVVIILASAAFLSTRKSDAIVIGSKNFNEQLILGNMLATLIEKNTDIKVERKLKINTPLRI